MSSSQITSKLAKPQLRGYFKRSIRFHLTLASILSLSGGMAYKYLIAEPRKRKYIEFYKTYDIEKEEARITALGLWEDPYQGDQE